jgi:hypothetical protein
MARGVDAADEDALWRAGSTQRTTVDAAEGVMRCLACGMVNGVEAVDKVDMAD